jgi:hypothetical protein
MRLWSGVRSMRGTAVARYERGERQDLDDEPDCCPRAKLPADHDHRLTPSSLLRISCFEKGELGAAADSRCVAETRRRLSTTMRRRDDATKTKTKT